MDLKPPALSVDEMTQQFQELQARLKQLGVSSADVAMSFDGKPVVKSFKMMGAAAVEQVAHANPANIQEVAASQLALSNSFYQTVLTQAQKSFQWALIAAGVGVAFFIAAISFLLMTGKPGVSYISGLGGGVSELIAALNFWLYGRASQHMESFHIRLEQMQRFILANSVCENLTGETQNRARAELVHTIASARPDGDFQTPEEPGRRSIHRSEKREEQPEDRLAVESPSRKLA